MRTMKIPADAYEIRSGDAQPGQQVVAVTFRSHGSCEDPETFCWSNPREWPTVLSVDFEHEEGEGPQYLVRTSDQGEGDHWPLNPDDTLTVLPLRPALPSSNRGGRRRCECAPPAGATPMCEPSPTALLRSMSTGDS